MKNKKYLTYATMLLLLGVIIAPGINASIVQISVDKNENMVDLGRIHGSVYEASFFESPPVILAKLVLETEGITKEGKSFWQRLKGIFTGAAVGVGQEKPNPAVGIITLVLIVALGLLLVYRKKIFKKK